MHTGEAVQNKQTIWKDKRSRGIKLNLFLRGKNNERSINLVLRFEKLILELI